MGQSRFNGGTQYAYTLDVDAAVARQNAASNYSDIYWRIIVYKAGGTGYHSGPNSGNNGAADGPNGGNPDLWQAGGFGYDFQNVGSIMFVQAEYRLNHDGNGNANYFVNGAMNLVNIGYADASSGWKAAPRIPQTPGTPGTPTISSITPTTAVGKWTAASRGHADIDHYLLRYHTNPNPDAAGYKDVVVNGSTLQATMTGLLSGQVYYSKTYAHNGDGYSAGSAVRQFQTVPAVAPPFTVTPSPSGVSATIQLSPPGNVTGVTAYVFYVRSKGESPVQKYVTKENSYTVTNLVPGRVYEWAAYAAIGAYETPVSAWLAVPQPNPSTGPGDYFDGATLSTGRDELYKWTGATDLSTSQAISHAPTGWMNFAEAAAVSGGTGAIARVTGGVYGTYGARATFHTDATAAGFAVGPSGKAVGRADVAPSESYFGSIYAKVSRSQRLAAQIIYYNSAGAIVSRVVGTPRAIGVDTWNQFAVTGRAPSTGEWATITVIDVAGDGWSLWRGGDVITLDAAMLTLGSDPIPYFDGGFADGGGYAFDWTGTVDASTSIRTNKAISPAAALVDPACPVVPAPPRPPVINSIPCVAISGLWRRYLAAIDPEDVSDWLDTLPTFTIRTKSVAERQVRIRVYANPFKYPISQVDTAAWCGEQIISYIPANSTITLDAEIQRVFASVAGGALTGADHLLYGTGGTPATWPVLSCGIPYVVSFDTPLTGTTTPVGNIELGIELSRRI